MLLSLGVSSAVAMHTRSASAIPTVWGGGETWVHSGLNEGLRVESEKYG